MEQYAILYRRNPAWKVGQDSPDEIPESQYPDDYAGKVIDVCPKYHKFTSDDLSDGRMIVELGLTPEEREGLADRRMKIEAGKPVPTTFEDRWGQIAATLRANFDDAEQAERECNEAADETVDGRRFGELSALAKKLLPPPMISSAHGTVRTVGPGKTYSAIQIALDALWAAIGSAVFTENEYIRIFADTYAENVAPNAVLNPDETGGSALIIEGDPADDLANIVVSPAGGTYTFFINCDQCMLRHLKIAGTPTAQIVRTSTGCTRLEVLDCEITGAKTGIYSLYYARIENSSITVTVNAIAVRIGSSNYGGLVSRCKIVGPGKATSTSYGIYNAGRYIGLTVELTNISGFRYGVYLKENSGIRVANCTLYDCTYGIHLPEGLDPIVWITNTVSSVVDYPFYFVVWPEESATVLGPSVVQHNNVFHSYTAIGWNGAAGKTFAEWIAFNQVDASGDLDATDPKLVNPSAGDFGLQDGSPCIGAGVGVGLSKDVNGDPMDLYHPDIGSTRYRGPHVHMAAAESREGER